MDYKQIVLETLSLLNALVKPLLQCAFHPSKFCSKYWFSSYCCITCLAEVILTPYSLVPSLPIPLHIKLHSLPVLGSGMLFVSAWCSIYWFVLTNSLHSNSWTAPYYYVGKANKLSQKWEMKCVTCMNKLVRFCLSSFAYVFGLSCLLPVEHSHLCNMIL